MTVVTWDSPIPSAEGEQVFVAQVDFNETGTIMADMALDILGADGGKFAVLSASPDAANQNAWIAAMKEGAQGSQVRQARSCWTSSTATTSPRTATRQALALVDKYPDMKLIMAPTTVGIAGRGQGHAGRRSLRGRSRSPAWACPSEMVSYSLNGCAPEFALWSFVDLGYLTYYATYLMATGALKGEEGETFEAGRMGKYTIEKDPTRDAGLRVLMGPFTIYDKTNVEAASK